MTLAFDMYADSRHEKIDHHEEFIFPYVTESAQFPELNFVWKNYYRDPKLSPTQSNKVVHELIQLKPMLQSNSEHSMVGRLLQFFSYSYLNQVSVCCVSD
ncbi:hypothetical protein A7985_07460 [Pseudoalteromonas luteoviolacea]|uniref:Uncharacterized protein n=1 Tax=Pseudoalteromonas luteoviolacea TaxID=43657 RepID=A0A1C0TWR5_9GAMM|nr:hypothetical protein A7985_07460 [Pseudoalteromonas luteoviolacea]